MSLGMPHHKTISYLVLLQTTATAGLDLISVAFLGALLSLHVHYQGLSNQVSSSDHVWGYCFCSGSLCRFVSATQGTVATTSPLWLCHNVILGLIPCRRWVNHLSPQDQGHIRIHKWESQKKLNPQNFSFLGRILPGSKTLYSLHPCI